MSTTAVQTSPALTIAETAERGQTLPCPCCGEENATITLNLADAESLVCQDCEADFTVDQVRAFIAKWGRLLAWIETMPTAAK